MRKTGVRIVLFLLSAFIAVGGQAQAGDASELIIPTEPNVTVVRVSVAGGHTLHERHTYLLTNDGVLQDEHRSGSKTRVREVRIPFVELQELVDALVDGGLMSWDSDDVRRRFKEKIGAVPSHHDIPAIQMSITLQRSIEDTTLVTQEIEYAWSPSMVKYESPDLDMPEVDALIYFWRAIRGYLSRPE